MLNTPELTIANPFLPTTDYDAITDNQAENISVAFTNHKASIKNDSTLQQLYTQAKPLGKIRSDDKYYNLQEMSIYDMTIKSYLYNPKIKGSHLNLRKIAVMPTLHCYIVRGYKSATVLEVLSQLPDFLQSRGSIFFYTDFPKNLFSTTLDRKIIKYYGEGGETKKSINIAMLSRYNLFVGETTFFKLAIDSLQKFAIKTIIKQINNSNHDKKDIINNLPLPTILIKDIFKVYNSI